MAIFVDIFMAACLLLALVLGVRQGFLQSLARVAIVIVALLGAAWLAEHLADPAAKWLEPMLTEKIQQQMDGQAAAADDPSLAAAGLLETFDVLPPAAVVPSAAPSVEAAALPSADAFPSEEAAALSLPAVLAAEPFAALFRVESPRIAKLSTDS